MSNRACVLQPGLQTTVQDYPGRTGFWHVGVPPSGPMDMLAFRLANRLVGNDESAAGLECTMTGPRLRFHADAVVVFRALDCEPTWRYEEGSTGRAVELIAPYVDRVRPV